MTNQERECDMPPKFSRTARAARKDKLSRWEIVEAIAADAIEAELPIVSAETVGAAVEAFRESGDELTASTVKGYCIVAKFDHESTQAQRDTWRRYGVSTVGVVAEGGWSPEAAEELLGRAPVLSYREIRAAVRPPQDKVEADPENWTPEQWEKFDAKVVAAVETLMHAMSMVRHGIYRPSTIANNGLMFIKPDDGVDWDAELAEITG